VPQVLKRLDRETGDHASTPRRSRGGRLLRWAERLLVMAGAAMLMWCAVLVSDTIIAQRMARHALEAASIAAKSVLPPATGAAKDVAPRDPAVHTGSAIAALSIPRVHLSAVVLHGSDAQTLRRGPGHLENTAFPGQSGNVVIAGHRDSFFWPLRNIKLGDDIFLDTPDGQFQYRVMSVRVVNPHDVSVLTPTNEATLTLITCYPFWVVGNAPDRFVVRAAAVVYGAAAPVALEPAPLHGAPVVDEPAASESVVLGTDVVHDDESLVRLAVERFRLTYNARLVSRNDVRPGGPLRFQACDIAVTDDRATATCTPAVGPRPDDEPAVDMFMLERIDAGWAIRSIVLNQAFQLAPALDGS
jgi:sortase A